MIKYLNFRGRNSRNSAFLPNCNIARIFCHKSDFENTYIDFETISKRNISTNVNAFMKATALCRDNKYVHCFIPTELQNVKCTIVSATADEKIYRMCFPDRYIHFEVCKKAKYMGHIIQDCSRSCS